jgi:hypothetical protein
MCRRQFSLLSSNRSCQLTRQGASVVAFHLLKGPEAEDQRSSRQSGSPCRFLRLSFERHVAIDVICALRTSTTYSPEGLSQLGVDRVVRRHHRRELDDCSVDPRKRGDLLRGKLGLSLRHGLENSTGSATAFKQKATSSV